jgi:hypothetical protein
MRTLEPLCPKACDENEMTPAKITIIAKIANFSHFLPPHGNNFIEIVRSIKLLYAGSKGIFKILLEPAY